MSTVQKGKISSIDGNAARVTPYASGEMVTKPLVIPQQLRGEYGRLVPGVMVVYAVFPDGSGIILSRADGELYFSMEDR